MLYVSDLLPTRENSRSRDTAAEFLVEICYNSFAVQQYCSILFLQLMFTLLSLSWFLAFLSNRPGRRRTPRPERRLRHSVLNRWGSTRKHGAGEAEICVPRQFAPRGGQGGTGVLYRGTPPLRRSTSCRRTCLCLTPRWLTAATALVLVLVPALVVETWLYLNWAWGMPSRCRYGLSLRPGLRFRVLCTDALIHAVAKSGSCDNKQPSERLLYYRVPSKAHKEVETQDRLPPPGGCGRPVSL